MDWIDRNLDVHGYPLRSRRPALRWNRGIGPSDRDPAELSDELEEDQWKHP